MRVLHLLDSLNRGGAETLALDVCRNARRFGLEVTLATCGGGALKDAFHTSGVEVVQLPRRFPVDPRVVRGLRELMRERSIQIAHGHQAVDGVHLHLAALGTGVKKVLSFHGFVPDAKNRTALKFLISRMDANIVVSEGLKQWLRKEDGLDTGRLQVLYNGVDPERIKPGGADVRAELKIPATAPLAGMVGNFYRDPRKDQLTVAKALVRAFAELPDAHFLFAGGVEAGAEAKLAECREVCERAGIADRVHLLGPRSDIPDILAALDLFVISSLHEGLPIALKEAMLAGTPVLASDIPPHVEASDGGRFAELFATRGADDLAGKMIALLRDANRRVELAAIGREYAANKFGIDAHLANLSALYESLLKENAR